MSLLRLTLGTLLAGLPLLGATAQEARPGGFMDRLVHAYTDDLLGTAAAATPAADPPRRGLETPLASPPFPFGEYPGLFVGMPYAPTSGPLMQALSGTPAGNLLDANRVSIYGWASTTLNGSTSRNANAPLGYDIRANRLELNQALLRIERLPDTVQTDHVDWGFRFDSLYGLDYRFTTAKGVLSDQLLKRNNTYGYDPFVFYGEVYVPQVAQGMTIRIGRYYTFQDVESVTAPDNYLPSHSMLNTYDAYTQFGVLTTTQLNRNVAINLGLSAGNDIAPWEKGAHPTLTACLRYTTDSNNDSNLACIVSLGNQRYAYGNVQNFVSNTWTHRFTERFHMANQAYAIWQSGVPGVTGTALTTAFANYLSLKVSDAGRVTLRNELFNDPQGQRTGSRTLYSTHSIGYAHTIGPFILRPELRFDHAYDARAYDRGTARSQFTAFLNLVTRF